MHTPTQDARVYLSDHTDMAFLQGHSPPWDAPEVYSDHIMPSQLPQLDIYCWGLLFWQVMLDGRTPLDRRASHAQAFGNSSTQELDPTDRFLERALSSLQNHGLDERFVSDVLRKTLRYSPSDRLPSFHHVLGLINRYSAALEPAEYARRSLQLINTDSNRQVLKLVPADMESRTEDTTGETCNDNAGVFNFLLAYDLLTSRCRFTMTFLVSQLRKEQKSLGSRQLVLVMNTWAGITTYGKQIVSP
jgi:hypothetical protein